VLVRGGRIHAFPAAAAVAIRNATQDRTPRASLRWLRERLAAAGRSLPMLAANIPIGRIQMGLDCWISAKILNSQRVLTVCC